MGMELLVNIDVSNLPEATAFCGAFFGLTVARRLGPQAAELSCEFAPKRFPHRSGSSYLTAKENLALLRGPA
jgi:hypothetical protein